MFSSHLPLLLPFSRLLFPEPLYPPSRFHSHLRICEREVILFFYQDLSQVYQQKHSSYEPFPFIYFTSAFLYEIVIDLFSRNHADEARTILTEWYGRKVVRREEEEEEEKREAVSMLCLLYGKYGLFYSPLSQMKAFEESYHLWNANWIGIYEIIQMKDAKEYALQWVEKLYLQPYLHGDEYESNVLYDAFLKNVVLRHPYLNGTNLPIYFFQFEYAIIQLLRNAQKYVEAFQISNRLLCRFTFHPSQFHIPDALIQELQYIRSTCLPHVIETYSTYPEAIVQELVAQKEKDKDKSEGRVQKGTYQVPFEEKIIFTITTCKRYDLFERTMNSFLNTTPPCDLRKIGEWLCVDDNSSESDREKMALRYPFFTFIWKRAEEKGHLQSMNLIRDYVLASKYTYTLHMEDDWHSVCKMDFITRAQQIMAENPRIHQVLFNRNYGQTLRPEDMEMNGGVIQYAKYGGEDNGFQRYRLHDFLHQESPEFQKHWSEIRESGKGTVANWPHYSLNPSLLKVEVYERCGRFEKKSWHFEFDYACSFLYHGFQTAFFDGIFKIHIGKILGSNTEKNAYELNAEEKFEKGT